MAVAALKKRDKAEEEQTQQEKPQEV